MISSSVEMSLLAQNSSPVPPKGEMYCLSCHTYVLMTETPGRVHESVRGCHSGGTILSVDTLHIGGYSVDGAVENITQVMVVELFLK